MIQPRIQVKFPIKHWYKFLCKQPLYQPKANEFLLNHNRSGLLLALKALGLPQGSNVGVMAYNCHTVMNAVDAAGLSVTFIDVTTDIRLDLDDLRGKKECLSALIVSHLFGLANDMDAVKSVCPDIPIIEDCAHAYGMASCGRKGDFSVYSIGMGKFPSVGDGGILKVNNPYYLGVVKQQYEQIPQYSKKEEYRLLFSLILMHLLHQPIVYSYFTLPLLKRNNNRITPAKEIITPVKMSDGISTLYTLSLSRIEGQRQRQQNAADSLTKFLSNSTDTRPLNLNLNNSNCFMFPVYCNSPEQVKKEFRRKGIETETHFRHCIFWAKEYGYQEGECPTTEHLVKHLLMIPTYKEFKL